MLLEDRNAVIYGGGGAIGGAVARAFAREGARVVLAGRTQATLEEVADDIRSAGGRAETAEVDALDEGAVDDHADAVAAQAGGIEAIESVRRQLAAELGRHGVRVVTLRTGGVPESLPEGIDGREAIIEKTIVAPTMLGRAATLEDVGNVAAFVASDRARTLTAAAVNISCGALVD